MCSTNAKLNPTLWVRCLPGLGNCSVPAGLIRRHEARVEMLVIVVFRCGTRGDGNIKPLPVTGIAAGSASDTPARQRTSDVAAERGGERDVGGTRRLVS